MSVSSVHSYSIGKLVCLAKQKKIILIRKVNLLHKRESFEVITRATTASHSFTSLIQICC